MNTVEEQIETIESEIRKTPYHKGTERHIGLLRAKISKLKDKLGQSKKSGGGGGGYAVKKQGDATIALVGPPSVGKSTLINKLTNAESRVAPYSFTTVTVIPGMMKYRDAHLQILDVPGLIEGAEEGKGRGREVLSVVRGADLLIIMTDYQNRHQHKSITAALERNGIRINKLPPKVRVEKKVSGGLVIKSNIKQDLDRETIKDVAREMGFKSGEISIDQKLTMEDLIDSFSKNRVYTKAFYAISKIDQVKNAKRDGNMVYLSAEADMGLEELKNKIWETLEFVVVYLIKPLAVPSKTNPIVMKEGDTLADITAKIGSDFEEQKKRAKIWGNGSKFPGQSVSLSHEVREGMMVRFG